MEVLTILAFACATAAVVLLTCCAVILCWGTIAKAWEKAHGDKTARWVFVAAVSVATMYGGAKHRTGGITYPYTDPEARYLTDAGSYVTNDAVYVAFTRLIAPATAPLMIDYRQIDQTNDTDWVNYATTTFAAFDPPQLIQFPAATNYNWVVYTTWTPGLTVQTNGVWHAYWGVDRKGGGYLIPVRTCVRDGGEVIATPKSRWDSGANEEQQEADNGTN